MFHFDKSHKLYLPDNLEHLLMNSEFVTPGPVPCIPVVLKSLKTQNNSQQASRRMLRSITDRLFSLHVEKRFSRVFDLCDFLSVIKLSTIQMSKILCAYKTGTGLISEQTGRSISLLKTFFFFFFECCTFNLRKVWLYGTLLP